MSKGFWLSKGEKEMTSRAAPGGRQGEAAEDLPAHPAVGFIPKPAAFFGGAAMDLIGAV